MRVYQTKEFETVFNKLVDSANEKYKDNNMSKKQKEKYIEFVYREIAKYLMSKKILLSRSYLHAYVQIIYNSEMYGEKIYRIFCPWDRPEFYIPNNIYDVDCVTVNFFDLINYFKLENQKKQLKNIKIGINELLEQGLTKEEIEIQIKSILYNKQENPKQKIKRLQK